MLDVYANRELHEAVGRNPFYIGPYRPFQPAQDYQHDIELLRAQLTALHDILASISQ